MVVGGSTSHRYTENHTSRVEVIDLNYIKRCKLKSNYKFENLSSDICGVGGGAMKEYPVVCGWNCDKNEFELTPQFEPTNCFKWSEDQGWKNIATLKVPRGYFSSSVTDEGLVMIGGISYDLVDSYTFPDRSSIGFQNIEILRDISSEWKLVNNQNEKSSNEILFHHCAVLINSTTIMIIGGAKATKMNMIRILM